MSHVEKLPPGLTSNYPLVDESEVDAELSKLKPTAYVDVRSQFLPLGWLTDRQFELLAHGLAQAESRCAEARFDRARLLAIGADKGRDVVLLGAEGVVGIIQCKKYARRLTLPEALAELMRFALRAILEPSLVSEPLGFIYQLWTVEEITGPAAEFFDAPKAFIAAQRGDMLAAAQNAREGIAALRAADERTATGQNEAAVELVTGFALQWVGPSSIRDRLARDDGLRQSFFRSPSDGPNRARRDEIDLLMAKWRASSTDRVMRGLNYVRRPALDAALSAFLAKPERGFAIVGGSGSGKSTWAAHFAAAPPTGLSVQIIRAEDVYQHDRNVAETFARILGARPMGQVSSTELVQSIWEWLDADNRLIVIDGLDRATPPTTRQMSNWLLESIENTAEMPVRFLVTSRPFAWSAIVQAAQPLTMIFHATADQSAQEAPGLRLSSLDGDELDHFCAAYGVDRSIGRLGSLRNPGLIARWSRLNASPQRSVPTRMTVLRATLDDLGAELSDRAGLGRQRFIGLLEHLGDRLIATGSGVIDLREMRSSRPDLLPLIDALAAADIATVRDDGLRLEPDDLVEYLMALRLDVDAIAHWLSATDGDVALGAASTAIALLSAKPARLEAIIRQMVVEAGPRSKPMQAAALAVLEIEDPELMRRQAEIVIAAWKSINLLMPDALGSMIDAIALSGHDRLRLMLPLAKFEDDYDWRGKYWYDPALVNSRSVTRFGHAAARATRQDPVACIELLESFREGGGEGAFVADGLVYEAGWADPAGALAYAWNRLMTGAPKSFRQLTNIIPVQAAEHLGRVTLSDGLQVSRASQELWTILTEARLHFRENKSFARSVSEAASHLLHEPSDDRSRTRLLIAQLLGTSAREPAEQLLGLWSSVDDDTFWKAVEALPDRRIALIDDLIAGKGRRRNRCRLLETMPGDIVPPSDWPKLADLLGAAARQPELAEACARAVEEILYHAEASGGIGVFEQLTHDLAGSSDDKIRLPILYWAGSRTRSGKHDQIAARDRILEVLTRSETGGTLSVLVWKLAESAPERHDVAERLLRLVTQFGTDAIDEHLSWRLFANSDACDAVLSAWRRVPTESRPRLSHLEELL